MGFARIPKIFLISLSQLWDIVCWISATNVCINEFWFFLDAFEAECIVVAVIEEV